MKHIEINKFEGLEEAINENVEEGEVKVTLNGIDKYVLLDVEIYELLLADLLANETDMVSSLSDVELRIQGLNTNGEELKLSSEEFEDLKEKVVEALERQLKPKTKYN